MSADQPKKKVNCFRCRHFYITYQHQFPRGCKALGFKSREMPAQAVFKASGMECLHFQKRYSQQQRSNY